MNRIRLLNPEKICKNTAILGPIPSEKSLLKDTFNMAWPSVVDSFSVNLAGMIDTIMVGSLGASAIAAVGLTTQPKFFAMAIFFALNVASSAIIARRKGEDNRESANRVLRMTLLITIVLTLLITVACIVFANPIIQFMGAKEDTHKLAVEYFQIVMAGIVFNTITIIINGAQRGAGNTRISMVTNIISNVINTMFNYVLIGGHFGFPKMGVKGAAVATVIGAACGCFLSVRSLFRKNSFIYFSAAKGFVADELSRKSMVKIGSSAFVEQMCMRVGFILFVKTIANLGTVEMAAHQIGMNMMSLSFSIGDGFSIAAATLIGQSLGRKRPDIAKIYGSACQRIGFICALCISLVYTLFGKEIYKMFVKDLDVIGYGVTIMQILSVILFLQIAQVVQFGCLRGAGDTKFTAIVSLISVTIIRPGMSALLCYPMGLGLIGAWIGTGCDQLVRFSLSHHRFKKNQWMKLKL